MKGRTHTWTDTHYLNQNTMCCLDKSMIECNHNYTMILCKFCLKLKSNQFNYDFLKSNLIYKKSLFKSLIRVKYLNLF